MKRKMPSNVQTVRKLDNVGRISLPPKFIDYLDLNEGDTVLIYLNNEKKIIMKKYPLGCVFCGSKDELFQLSGFDVCSKCRKKENSEMILVKNRYEKQEIPNSRRMVIPFKVRHDIGLHIEKKDNESDTNTEEARDNDKLLLELHEDYILIEKYTEE